MKTKKLLITLMSLFALFAFANITVHANGTKTQVFIANEIIMELEAFEGQLVVDGYGLITVPDSIKEAILNHKDAFRAGAVGPDFYPSYLVGLRGIHANESGYYIQKLYEDFIKNPPADKNKRQEIEAFLLGMQLHYCGDLTSRKEFSSLTGGNFPRIAYDMDKGDANRLLRYTAIEGYYDSILPDRGYSYKISAPIDFVAKHMAFNGEVGGEINRGLNYKYKYSNKDESKVGTELPLVLFVKSHNEVINFNNTLNGNIVGEAATSLVQMDRWIGGIQGSIVEWIRSNEKAAERVLEGEATAYALTKEYTEFINGPLENMIPARDVITVVKNASLLGLLDEVTGASDMITGEVLDFLVQNVAGGVESPKNELVFEPLLNDKKLFSDDTDTLKSKIKTAGDKGVQETINMTKLILGGHENFKNIVSSLGVESQYRKNIDNLNPLILKESHRGLNISLKTGKGALVDGYGTDSDVFCYVTFNDGKVLKRKLDKNGYNDFERGDNDTYYVEFDEKRNLSEINNIKIGVSYLDDWHLERAVISTSSGRTLTSCSPNYWFKSSNSVSQIYPFIPTKTIDIRIKTDEGWAWKGFGTDGDIYARIYYGYDYSDYKLDKANYNDFENGDDDTYPVPLKYGYEYNDISRISIYRRGGDDWRAKEAWVRIKGREYSHKNLYRWIDGNQVEICGNVNHKDTSDAGKYRDVEYGPLNGVFQFLDGIYSLDKVDSLNDNFHLLKNDQLTEKVYERLIGDYNPDKETFLSVYPDDKKSSYDVSRIKNVKNRISNNYTAKYNGDNEFVIDMNDINYWNEYEKHDGEVIWEDTIDLGGFKKYINTGRMLCGGFNEYITKEGETIDFILWYSTDNGITYKMLKHDKVNSASWDYIIFNDIGIPKGTTHIKTWIHAQHLESGDVDLKFTNRAIGVMYK